MGPDQMSTPIRPQRLVDLDEDAAYGEVPLKSVAEDVRRSSGIKLPARFLNLSVSWRLAITRRAARVRRGGVGLHGSSD